MNLGSCHRGALYVSCRPLKKEMMKKWHSFVFVAILLIVTCSRALIGDAMESKKRESMANYKDAQ